MKGSLKRSIVGYSLPSYSLERVEHDNCQKQCRENKLEQKKSAGFPFAGNQFNQRGED
ncbi:hypothetical protein [Planomicrobium sp. Y74]|uniref:hypothetical protein n=1 Tax=Planomicrobium sp. Y74 TaxID=2478977 RepID=UPI001314A10D|nr:hypothetical protein [Planomicrobium sp. Y74]